MMLDSTFRNSLMYVYMCEYIPVHIPVHYVSVCVYVRVFFKHKMSLIRILRLKMLI